MKTSFKSSALTKISTLAVLFFGIAGVANAGPGIEYWRRMDQVRTEKLVPAVALPYTGACTDSKTVAITEVHKDWANGKGPMHFVKVGTKQICRSCGGATTIMEKTWVNGKGPQEGKRVPVEHSCNSECKSTTRS